jgi:hypothetical protein
MALTFENLCSFCQYRTALGLPGGIENDAVSVLKEFAEQKGMTVLPGKGNEQVL